MVLCHDLGSHLSSLSESVTHDGDQHVQEMQDNCYTGKDKQCQKDWVLSSVTNSETISISLSQNHLKNVPYRVKSSNI